MNKVLRVLKIALPAVGEMILYMLVWVIDTMIVGNYGGNVAVTSVGFSSEIISTFINIFIATGISIGITALVAKYYGAGKIEKAEEVLSEGLLFGTIIAFLIVLIISIFAKNILTIANADKVIVENGSMFIRLVVVGSFFNMIINMLNAGLRGIGNTVVPMIISAVVVCMTTIFDLILVPGRFGIKPLGIRGSAISTSIAYVSAFVIHIIYYTKYSGFKPRIRYIKNFNADIFKKLIRLTIPSSMQEAAFSISRLMSLTFIMQLGTVAFAANQITNTIESVSFMPGWGFGIAATSLTGQCFGAKDYKKAKEYGNISLIFGIVVMAACSILFLSIPNVLIGGFIKEKETLILGTQCLMVASIEQPFIAVSMVIGGILKGSGNTVTPFVVSLISSWAIRVPLMYMAVFVWKFNVVSVWYITAAQWGFEGIVLYILYRTKFIYKLR